MKMRKTMAIALATACMTLMSCVEHEEVAFDGIVVGGRNCSSTLFDQNMGYIIQLTYPQDVGGSITNENGQKMENLVVLYEPDRHIMVGDYVHGTFYWDDKYSRSNCTIRWDEDLPEGVILEVYVD